MEAENSHSINRTTSTQSPPLHFYHIRYQQPPPDDASQSSSFFPRNTEQEPASASSHLKVSQLIRDYSASAHSQSSPQSQSPSYPLFPKPSFSAATEPDTTQIQEQIESANHLTSSIPQSPSGSCHPIDEELEKYSMSDVAECGITSEMSSSSNTCQFIYEDENSSDSYIEDRINEFRLGKVIGGIPPILPSSSSHLLLHHADKTGSAVIKASEPHLPRKSTPAFIAKRHSKKADLADNNNNSSNNNLFTIAINSPIPQDLLHHSASFKSDLNNREPNRLQHETQSVPSEQLSVQQEHQFNRSEQNNCSSSSNLKDFHISDEEDSENLNKDASRFDISMSNLSLISPNQQQQQLLTVDFISPKPLWQSTHIPSSTTKKANNTTHNRLDMPEILYPQTQVIGKHIASAEYKSIQGSPTFYSKQLINDLSESSNSNYQTLRKSEILFSSNSKSTKHKREHSPIEKVFPFVAQSESPSLRNHTNFANTTTASSQQQRYSKNTESPSQKNKIRQPTSTNDELSKRVITSSTTFTCASQPSQITAATATALLLTNTTGSPNRRFDHSSLSPSRRIGYNSQEHPRRPLQQQQYMINNNFLKKPSPSVAVVLPSTSTYKHSAPSRNKVRQHHNNAKQQQLTPNNAQVNSMKVSIDYPNLQQPCPPRNSSLHQLNICGTSRSNLPSYLSSQANTLTSTKDGRSQLFSRSKQLASNPSTHIHFISSEYTNQNVSQFPSSKIRSLSQKQPSSNIATITISPKTTKEQYRNQQYTNPFRSRIATVTGGTEQPSSSRAGRHEEYLKNCQNNCSDDLLENSQEMRRTSIIHNNSVNKSTLNHTNSTALTPNKRNSIEYSTGTSILHSSGAHQQFQPTQPRTRSKDNTQPQPSKLLEKFKRTAMIYLKGKKSSQQQQLSTPTTYPMPITDGIIGKHMPQSKKIQLYIGSTNQEQLNTQLLLQGQQLTNSRSIHAETQKTLKTLPSVIQLDSESNAEQPRGKSSHHQSGSGCLSNRYTKKIDRYNLSNTRTSEVYVGVNINIGNEQSNLPASNGGVGGRSRSNVVWKQQQLNTDIAQQQAQPLSSHKNYDKNNMPVQATALRTVSELRTRSIQTRH